MEKLLELKFNYWILQTIAMLITAFLIPRLRITSIFGALFIVIALAFVNSKIWDAALFLQIPDHFTYQSVLLVLTNGFLFWVLVKLLPGIEVDGFLAALAAPIVFSATSLLIAHYHHYINWGDILDRAITVLQNLRQYFEQSSSEPAKNLIGNHN